MQEYYEKSLEVIKTFDVKNEKDYNKLVTSHLILNSKSLKYITGITDFKKIIELSKEVV